MCMLEEYISNLQSFLTGTKEEEITIIRKHSKKLEQLGDISFPLNIKNWYHLIDNNKVQQDSIGSILEYCVGKSELKQQIDVLKEECVNFQLIIEKVVTKENEASLYLQRSATLYKTVIIDVLTKSNTYGSSNIFTSRIIVDWDSNIENLDFSKIDLTTLRMLELKIVASNFLIFIIGNKENRMEDTASTIIFTLNSMNKNQEFILCGPVLNEKGVKNMQISAEELFKKRTMDMRLMAQHRYKVQVVPNTPRESYFINIVKKLGRACVTIEMMSNKPNKALKVTLNDLRTANKGAAFIFYNCARLSVLLKEFEKRVSQNVYPALPNANEIDFALLNQPEEWELFYVYILQFPMVIKSCVKDINKGIFNPQHLVTFLSNLSSVFSAYYRRVRILRDPREHLFGVLHARIYLLKALQVIFHNALFLLNIEPIKEM